jgi:hypothetical protein
MNWGILSSIFILGAFKFLFSAIPGAVAEIPYWQTMIASGVGALLSALFFFSAADYFRRRSFERMLKRKQDAEIAGIAFKEKRKFTRLNKGIVYIKRFLGVYGITLIGPLLLSVPIGAIIAAKFYGKRTETLPLLLLGITGHSIWLTLTYYSMY